MHASNPAINTVQGNVIGFFRENPVSHIGKNDLRRELELVSHELTTFDVVAISYLAQNRADEAEAVLNTGLANNPNNYAIHSDLYGVAAAINDESGISGRAMS